MNDRQSVLLTGASGFIGSRVLEKLVRAGFRVTILGRRMPGIPEASAAEFVHADFLEEGLAELLRQQPRADAVVHLAAIPKLGPSDDRLMWRLHVDTAGLLAGAAHRWGARFLHVSTAFVGVGHGGHLREGPAVEGTFANEYERTKTAAESAVLKACPRGSEILRPGIVLAGGRDSAEEQLASPLGMFLRLARTRGGDELPFQPHPATSLALSRRDDVADFIVARLAAPADHTAHYWNMIAPYPMGIREAGHALGFCFDGEKRWPALEPWRPYLEAQRTWDISGYFCESMRLGKPVFPIAAGELRAAVGKLTGVHGEAKGALCDVHSS